MKLGEVVLLLICMFTTTPPSFMKIKFEKKILNSLLNDLALLYKCNKYIFLVEL